MTQPASADHPDIDLDEEKKTAEYYLKHYDRCKEELEEKKLAIIEGQPHRPEVDVYTRDKYCHGDPTLTKAERMTREDILRTEAWLRAAEATRSHFDGQANTNHRDYIKMRYGEGKTPRTIAYELGVGYRTVFTIRDEVLNYMAFAHIVYEKANIFLRGKQNEGK